MATQQSNDPFGAPPAAGSTTTSITQPIGVPYYITDPATGQPMLGPNGQPLRWGAQVPNPGNQQQFGPGQVMPTSPGQFGPGQVMPTNIAPQYQLPRYFDGDQWLPAQLPPDQLASLQRKMVAAGLLKSGAAQLGVWDAASMNAYMQLLAFANSSGLDAQTALDRWGQQHAAAPPGAGLPTQVTNPDDLRKIFRQAVIDTRGEGWDQAKIDQMVAAFQGQEVGAQHASAAAADTGGTTTAAPSPQAFAEAQVRAQDPAKAGEHDALGFIGQFRQMLGGWQ